MSRETYQLLARRLETKTLFINWNRKYFFGKTPKLSDYYRQLQLHWKSPRRFLLCGNNRVGFDQTKILAKKIHHDQHLGVPARRASWSNTLPDRTIARLVNMFFSNLSGIKTTKTCLSIMKLQMLMVDKLSKNSIFVKNDFFWSGAYSGQRVELDLDGSGIKAEEVSRCSVSFIFLSSIF